MSNLIEKHVNDKTGIVTMTYDDKQECFDKDGVQVDCGGAENSPEDTTAVIATSKITIGSKVKVVKGEFEGSTGVVLVQEGENLGIKKDMQDGEDLVINPLLSDCELIGDFH